MKKFTVCILISFLFLMLAVAPGSYAQSERGDGNPEASALGKSAKGCAVGALAGSVVPGIGNVLGCVAGAVAWVLWWK